MCHFDLPGLRYKPEMAEKYRKIEGRPGEASKIGLPLFGANFEGNMGVGSQFQSSKAEIKNLIKVQSYHPFLPLWWSFWSSVSLVGETIDILVC